MILNRSLLLFLGSFVLATALDAQTNLPPDPFANLGDLPEIPDYDVEVDRKRGTFTVSADDGKYTAGSHFGTWNWDFQSERWGNYYVALRYTSAMGSKVGIQIKVGEKAVLKGYAPRTGGSDKENTLILGTAYLPESGEYRISMLTGDQSNGPGFVVKAVEFIPAPEAEVLGQSIDGVIQLDAKTATTYAKKMRYEPQEKKNCLGFWVDENDWAEWKFDVSTPGKFKVVVTQGCGPGNGGSEVALLVNDQTVKFTVEDTGGFQNWKDRELGIVDLAEVGEHKLAVKPLKKAGKAVMDIQKIVLTPVTGG